MSNLQKPIFLVGMPAVGKSTLGKQTAQKYALQFIDLDKYIEEVQNQSIAEIFSEKGEGFFRQIEAESLATIAQTQNLVIATGGGTPCFYNNMNLMLAAGEVIFLDFSLKLIIDRIAQNAPKRPMFAQKNYEEVVSKVQELYQQRYFHYQKAKYIVRNEVEFWSLLSKMLEK